MDISVIIPTYNRPHLLKKCLESLLFQIYPKENFEVIVVDDGNSKSTKEFVESFSKFLRLKYFYQKHKGPAAARNLGIKSAEGKIIAFIDDDFSVEKDWIEKIVKFHKDFPEEFVIQGDLLNSSQNNLFGIAWKFAFDIYVKNTTFVDQSNFNKNYVNVLGGSNVSFKGNILEKFGGYNEKLRVGEDLDLKYRLKNENIKILYIPEIRATHHYRSNIFAFIKHEFKKGRGRYYFRRLLKDRLYNEISPRVISLDNFRRLKAEQGFVRSLLILFIIYLREKLSFLAQSYERINSLAER